MAKEVKAPEPKVEDKAKSEIAELAEVMKEGLQSARDPKNFKIDTGDPNVESRFSVVKNKRGEVMLRENNHDGEGSSKLISLQLHSIEEKQKLEQEQEVELL